MSVLVRRTSLVLSCGHPDVLSVAFDIFPSREVAQTNYWCYHDVRGCQLWLRFRNNVGETPRYHFFEVRFHFFGYLLVLMVCLPVKTPPSIIICTVRLMLEVLCT